MSHSRNSNHDSSLSLYLYTDGEEWVNGLTHGIGCLIGLMGSCFLLSAALQGAPSYHFASCVIYCLALVGVYCASTLSHWIRVPRWRRLFRAWDQGLIFILIVATYTPIAMATLSGWWHVLTALLWVLAIVGFTSKVAHSHRVDNIILWLYLALGWAPIVVMPFIWLRNPRLVWLILAGGLAYSLGAVLLANAHRRKYLHAGWHVFVIVGSMFHFCGIYFYAMPK